MLELRFQRPTGHEIDHFPANLLAACGNEEHFCRRICADNYLVVASSSPRAVPPSQVLAVLGREISGPNSISEMT